LGLYVILEHLVPAFVVAEHLTVVVDFFGVSWVLTAGEDVGVAFFVESTFAVDLLVWLSGLQTLHAVNPFSFASFTSIAVAPFFI
jgi:hypothetical protein